jgi:hypothetical protein
MHGVKGLSIRFAELTHAQVPAAAIVRSGRSTPLARLFIKAMHQVYVVGCSDRN